MRLFATAVIAGIAAWVSYWHMAAVAARYGETSASPYLLPLSVDGLIVVASICLVELTARITDAEQPDLAACLAPAPATREEPENGRRQEADEVSPGTHPDPYDHPSDQYEDEDEAGMGGAPPNTGPGGDGLDLADDLVPLLPAAVTSCCARVRPSAETPSLLGCAATARPSATPASPTCSPR